MPTAERKLIDLGGSVVVALPPYWLGENGLEARDVVTVTTTDFAVIIRPPIVKRHERKDGSAYFSQKERYFGTWEWEDRGKK